MDYLPAERERGITIQSAAITFPWREHRLNLIDTPGHADFTFEVERSLRVLDGAITILDAVAGVEAQTEKVWRQANTRTIPRMVFINKMDRVGAGFGRTVREVAQKLNCRPIVLQLPIFENGLDGGEFIGVLDLISRQCLIWSSKSDGKVVEVTAIQEYQNDVLRDEASRARSALIETLSELDEVVVNAYLDCEDPDEIPVDILKSSIRKMCLESSLVPVFAGAAFRNVGIQPLLDAVTDYLPAPEERPRAALVEDGRPGILKTDAAPCALAFKVIIDSQRGPMVFVRVYSGTITRGTVLYNNSTKTKERAIKLLQMYADETREVDSISAGNIAVILGLKDTKTGDTLTLAKNSKTTMALQPIDIPPPVFIATLETNSASEAKSLELALDSLLREDPSLRVTYEEETGQTLLSGMGELHLEIAANRLIHDFKAKVEIGKLRIGYRETIDVSAQCADLYERVVGNVKSSVHLRVHLSPLSDDDDASTTGDQHHVESESLIQGNRIDITLPLSSSSSPSSTSPSADFSPADAKRALENGTLAALSRGLLLGYPLSGVHVALSVIRYETDTVLGTLSGSARHLVARALDEIGSSGGGGGTSVLEPIMAVTVSVAQDVLGSVMHDLTGSRGGQVVSLDDAGEEWKQDFTVYAPPDTTMSSSSSSSSDPHPSMAGSRIVHARVPLREMVGYSRALRTLTGGRGNFTMSLDRFERMNARGLQQLKKEIG